MTENMKHFLEKVSGDKALIEKISKLAKAELITMAKELGFELTEADFVPQEGELSVDELDTVAGGGDCYCAVGGGGTAGEKDNACACVLGGFGNSSERHERCVCALAGAGGSDD